MAEPTSLKFERALRDNDNAGVTPLDMLKDVVSRIESGEFPAAKAFVILAHDDGTPIVSCSADITTAEIVALVETVKLRALSLRGWI